MEIEIELKFVFNAEFVGNLYSTLDKFHYISHKKHFLHNVYFDTAERSLRQYSMGLRVRTCNNKSVQTIKTAGRVIGGLHQRPEYNEPIDELRPKLARFPSKIWPTNCDIKKLEEELTPIFSTDFERQTWLVEIAEGTLIEVAYDSGFIETNKGKVVLCEVELELVKGDEKQLFLLGNEIAKIPDVRLGNVSKAQRGYMLADNSTFNITPFTHSSINSEESTQQALLINMQHGLKQVQYHENSYIESQTIEALKELLKGVKFLHQNIVLFKDEVNDLNKAPWIEDLHWLARSFSWIGEYFTQLRLLENNAYYLRKLPKYKTLVAKIEQKHNDLPDADRISAILTSTRYCQFVLSFTEWLIKLEKHTFSSDQSNNISHFASKQLDKAWGDICSTLKENDALSMQQLLAYQGLLESNLLTGFSLGSIFSQPKREAFYSPWLDIKQGLYEFSMIQMVSELAQDENNNALQHDYLKWVKRKENSLLHALQQSKQQALLKAVYWHPNS